MGFVFGLHAVKSAKVRVYGDLRFRAWGSSSTVGLRVIESLRMVEWRSEYLAAAMLPNNGRQCSNPG